MSYPIIVFASFIIFQEKIKAIKRAESRRASSFYNILYMPHNMSQRKLETHFLLLALDDLTRLLLRLETLCCVFCIYLRLISGRTMQAAEPKLTIKSGRKSDVIWK
jgi:hypothetical protein